MRLQRLNDVVLFGDELLKSFGQMQWRRVYEIHACADGDDCAVEMSVSWLCNFLSKNLFYYSLVGGLFTCGSHFVNGSSRVFNL